MLAVIIMLVMSATVSSFESFLDKFAGRWEVTFDNDAETYEYSIDASGMVTLQYKGKTRKQQLQASDAPTTFPPGKGWFMTRNFWHHYDWEYIRILADGTMDIYYFGRDHDKYFKGVGKYCCHATATRNGFLDKLAGRWEVTFDNYAGTIEYNIDSSGMVTLQYKGKTKKQHLQASEEPTAFPPGKGWFKTSKLWYDYDWEYIRILADGTMDIYYFGRDHDKVFKGVGKYCCHATATRNGVR